MAGNVTRSQSLRITETQRDSITLFDLRKFVEKLVDFPGQSIVHLEQATDFSDGPEPGSITVVSNVAANQA